MPLPKQMQLEQDAADRMYAENSYINEPTAAEAMAIPLEPDEDEPHEAEAPSAEELEHRNLETK